MKNKVTIAVALYNNALHIERCINSVLNQTYKNIEIIIVDDGSTDDSLKKCETFHDSRIKLHKKTNGGLSSSRQFALDIATGDYICFIDADDYLNNEHIEKLLHNILISKADIGLCSVRFESEDGIEISNHVFSEVQIETARSIQKTDLFNNYNTIRHLYKLSDSWNKIYRLEFLKESQTKFCLPKGFNGSDAAFNHKLILHCPKISSTNYAGYVHVIYKNSAVHRKNRRIFEGSMLIFEQIIEECKNSGLLNEMRIQLSILFMQYVRGGFQDIVNENGYSFNTIQEKYAESKKAVKYYNISKSFFLFKDKGLMLFSFLYLYFPQFLHLYLKRRAQIINF